MKFDEKVSHDKMLIKRVTWIGLFTNVILATLKLVFGIIGASQAVLADAVHSLSDLSTDVAVLLGVKAWTAPADDDHPYGHRRIETLVTFGIGLILAIVAAGIGYNALFTIRDPDIRQPGWIAVMAPVLSIAAKGALYRWTVAVGTKTRSPAVIANAWHHRSDALSSWPVLIAVTASKLNPSWAFIDHVGALIVSLFILKVSWDIIRPVLVELSDQGVPAEERKQIAEIVERIDGIHEVHAIRTQRRGPTMQVDLHILVLGSLSVRQGHNISENVKNALMMQKPEITDVVVHTEPTT